MSSTDSDNYFIDNACLQRLNEDRKTRTQQGTLLNDLWNVLY